MSTTPAAESAALKPELEVIRARMQRATPGPWGWFGNTAVHHVYLATQRLGRHIVMQFDRWGMQGAEPEFFDRPEGIDSDGRARGARHRRARDIAVYEVAPQATSKDDPRVYREDFISLRNADASFIAHSRSDVEWLVDEVDRLQAIVDAGQLSEAADGQALRLVGWQCEHRWNTEAHGEHLHWDHRKSKLVKQPNTAGATYSLGQWGHDRPEQRCPAARPMYVIVEAVPA